VIPRRESTERLQLKPHVLDIRCLFLKFPLFRLSIRQILCHRLSFALTSDCRHFPTSPGSFSLLSKINMTNYSDKAPFPHFPHGVIHSVWKSSTKSMRICCRLSHSILQGNQKYDEGVSTHVCKSWGEWNVCDRQCLLCNVLIKSEDPGALSSQRNEAISC